MNKTMRQAVALGKTMAAKQHDELCAACGGSGHYDATDSPKCSACQGTGRVTDKQRNSVPAVCGCCHWWTGARHHGYGICRVTTNKSARLQSCDCDRFELEQYKQGLTI